MVILVDEVIALLSQLVANACVNDGKVESGQEIRNVYTLQKYFEGSDVELQVVEPQPGRATLIARVPPVDLEKDSLTLIGHIDVVPADVQKWSSDPFTVRNDGKRLYGRGVVDMLHMTATMAVVTKHIADANAAARVAGATLPYSGGLTFIAAADEEARGTWGMRWIEDTMPGDIDWTNCISESGGSHIHGSAGADSIVITVGEKGAAQRRLYISGDPGHGSVPYGKTSAVQRAALAVERLMSAQLPKASGPLWDGFVDAFEFDAQTSKALKDGTYEGDFEIFGTLASYAHAISTMTISATTLQSGEALNVIPSVAILGLDIRTLPGQDDDQVDVVLREALGDLVEYVTIERLICEGATQSSTSSRLYETMERVLESQHAGTKVIPVLFPGGTDLRMARRSGAVGYGFGSYAKARDLGTVYGQLHAHDEHLYLEDLELTVNALHQVVKDFLA